MSHIAWMEQAENDLAAAKVLSAANHHSQAVWFAEQAVEKGHKALLAALGLRYEETHYKKLGHDTSGISNLLPQELHEPSDPQVALRLATLKRRTEVCRYPSPPQSAGKPFRCQQERQQLVAPAQFFISSPTPSSSFSGVGIASSELSAPPRQCGPSTFSRFARGHGTGSRTRADASPGSATRTPRALQARDPGHRAGRAHPPHDRRPRPPRRRGAVPGFSGPAAAAEQRHERGGVQE